MTSLLELLWHERYTELSILRRAVLNRTNFVRLTVSHWELPLFVRILLIWTKRHFCSYFEQSTDLSFHKEIFLFQLEHFFDCEHFSSQRTQRHLLQQKSSFRTLGSRCSRSKIKDGNIGILGKWYFLCRIWYLYWKHR